MITFLVSDMSCGHCASTITRAIHAIDPQARVEVDLDHARVRIEAGEGDAEALARAISAAGYTPELASAG